MAEGEGIDKSSSMAAEAPGVTAAVGASRTVFLSYASADAEVANPVCQHLEAQGVSCWIAPRDVKPSGVYADAIVRAINGYFPTRVPKVLQDFRETPMIVGVLAILQLPKLAFVWTEILGARCRLV